MTQTVGADHVPHTMLLRNVLGTAEILDDLKRAAYGLNFEAVTDLVGGLRPCAEIFGVLDPHPHRDMRRIGIVMGGI